MAALLPLGQHAGSHISLDWVAELRAKLPNTTDPLTEALIANAPKGTSDVEAAFAGAMRSVVTSTLAEDDEMDEDS